MNNGFYFYNGMLSGHFKDSPIELKWGQLCRDNQHPLYFSRSHYSSQLRRSFPSSPNDGYNDGMCSYYSTLESLDSLPLGVGKTYSVGYNFVLFKYTTLFRNIICIGVTQPRS